MAFSTRGDAVSFNVGEGSTLKRSLQMGLTLNMDGGTINMGGNEQEIPAEEDDPLELDMAVETTDTYKKMEGGAVVAMSRSFETFAIEVVDSEDASDDIEIEGETVYFKRAEDGSYSKALEEDGDNDDSLAGLTVDMDFTALLPDGDVEAGDTWEVKSSGISGIFLPGGLPFSDDGESVESVIGTVAIPMLAEGSEEYSIKCTYVGAKEEGSLGEITFEFEGSTGGDVAELIMAMSEMEGDDNGMPEDITADAIIEFTGKGSMMWNLKEGHADSFEMVVEPTITVDMEMSQDMGDQSFELEFTIDFSGEMTWNMTVGADSE